MKDAPSHGSDDLPARIVAGEIAHSTLEGIMAREPLALRGLVAKQARLIATAGEQISEHCLTLPHGPARKAMAELSDELKKQEIGFRYRADRPQFYAGHGHGIVMTQVDGKFFERPMTAVELKAIEPARDMAVDIHRYAVYAGVCYIWIWEKIVAAYAGWVPAAEKDARISELLQVVDREVTKRRAAEAESAGLIEAAYRLGVKEGLQQGPIAAKFCCTPQRARDARDGH